MKGHICQLCKREGIIKITEHHLVPKQVGGAKLPVALLCQDCHKQIHALYTNKELAMRLNTLHRSVLEIIMKKLLHFTLTFRL